MAIYTSGDKETVIDIGLGIKVGIRNDGKYRINWADIDSKIYIHKEIYEELETKNKELNKKFENLAEKYNKTDEKIENLKSERNHWEEEFYRVKDIAVEKTISVDRWKRRLVTTNSIWFFATVLVIIFSFI